jgi:uncharacterized membrane protein YdbT with pleckstrin-like domain
MAASAGGGYAHSVDPEPGEEIFFHGHPSWRGILSFYLRGLVLTVLAGALAGAISGIAGRNVNVPLIVAVVVVAFVILLAVGFVKRIGTTYSITNQRLTIHEGILSRSLHETRLERVQNVSTRQRLLERMLRVGTVNFDTAGEAGYDFSFRGVSNPRSIVRTVDRAIREIHGGPAQV